MDVLNVSEELTLRDVEVRHVISVLGYGSNTINIFIFMDKNADTYYWTTSCHPPFEESKIYDIECKCDRSRGNKLTYVKMIGSGSTAAVQSEHPVAKPDAEDVLLGLKTY